MSLDPRAAARIAALSSFENDSPSFALTGQHSPRKDSVMNTSILVRWRITGADM
jgi:hypothetical protein